ncbi:MAG: hypothetical protein IKH75_00480 [Ruminococcus sp.]|nr:hypothetical protein [Ruminococcus sp.]
MYLEKEAKIIADYIKEPRYTQAVLVNGAWGAGKTYFVNNILMEQLTDYIVIHYSLYGVQSSEQVMSDLQREMIIKLIENKDFNVKGKNIKIPARLVGIAPNAISIFWKRIGLEVDDLNDLINKIDFDKSRIIIVFDDLERAGMEINEILGLINSYVECHGIKVIIISNENEIGSSRISANLPQKFLVASNTSISLKNDKNSTNGKNDKSIEKKFNYSELIERTKTLFSNDIVYNTIKEKLIGLTITLHANYNQLYDKIISKYALASSEFLLKNKDDFIEVFQDMECQNLRTFIFAVITFDKIFEAIFPIISKYKKQKYGKLFSDELLCIMRTVAFFSIRYKSGKKINTNTNSFSSLYYSGLFKGIKEYSFINKYICFHELDAESIMNDLSIYIENEGKKQKTKEEKDSLTFFKLTSFGWLDYNDEDVIKLSDQLYEELSANKYSVDYFKNIIIYLIQLEYHFDIKREKIKHTDDDYIKLMVNYIQNNEPINNQLELLEVISDEKDFLDKYNSYVSTLIKATKEKEVASSNIEFKTILDSVDWAEQFYKYCRENHDYFMDSRRFLSSFDMNLIKKKLLIASNKDIQRFSQAICSVYDFGNIRDFYNLDSSNLELIIDVLDDIYNDSKTNCTTKVVISSYKEKLKAKLKLLK